MRLTGVSEIELIGYESKNLDTVCYRGSAPLAHLALISQTTKSRIRMVCNETCRPSTQARPTNM